MSSEPVLSLLPQPVAVEVTGGEIRLDPGLAISAPDGWSAVVRRLLSPGTGLDLPDSDAGTLRVHCLPELPAEAYRLEVSSDGIDIAAADLPGLNWATQTLRQLLPPSVLRPAPSGAALTVPCVRISDEPRFGWRGLMLDVGRHFMPFSDLIALVDLMALHKYNVFHLHLTEDQGWRFESLRHPELNDRASWRSETAEPGQRSFDGTPHGGLYTQDQLRALVRYAEQRGITVVPEIEFPGHVTAVLAALPEFSNHSDVAERPSEPATGFGVFDSVLNMSDQAMELVFDVFTEVLDVFPSRYIHGGGDECPRTEWLASPAAATLAEQRGLSGPDQLQNWFTAQFRDWLAERGRTLIGWDEINNEGVLDGATLLAWRDARYGVEGAQAGQDVIMAPTSHTYFDYYPSDDPDERFCIGGHLTLEQAYTLDPLAGIDDDHRHHVLGTQCQLWTEYVPTARRAQYLLWPRACAHSEVAWSEPSGRRFAEFTERLAGHLARLDALGIDYRRLDGPLPWQQGGTGRWRRQTPAAAAGTDDES